MYSLGFISNFIISLKLLSQCILVALENWPDATVQLTQVDAAVEIKSPIIKCTAPRERKGL